MNMGGMTMATTSSMTMSMETSINSTGTAMNMLMTTATQMSSTTATMASMSMSVANTLLSTTADSHKSMKCSMSMLWNWTTKDVCFLSDKWMTKTPALFGGSCVGVWALLIAINWWRRIMYEYKSNCKNLRYQEIISLLNTGAEIVKVEDDFEQSFNYKYDGSNENTKDFLTPLFETLKHKWFWTWNKNLSIQKGTKIYVYPSIFEHLIYSICDTIEWCVHHVIMLLFMYFNGYIFISCMIGAGCGFFLFKYQNMRISNGGENVSKRCCL